MCPFLLSFFFRLLILLVYSLSKILIYFSFCLAPLLKLDALFGFFALFSCFQYVNVLFLNVVPGRVELPTSTLSV